MKNVLSLVFSAALLCISSKANADDTTSLTIRAPGEPTQAVGILIPVTGNAQVVQAKVESAANDSVKVSFQVPSNFIESGGLISAQVTTSEGTFVSPVTRKTGPGTQAELSACPLIPSLIPTMAQTGQVKALVDTRKRQRELAKSKLASFLTDDFVAKLTVLEKAAGLHTGKDPSINDHPVELIDRLARLMAVVERSAAQSSQ